MNSEERYHALDAVRASALLLGIAFHATMSFVPGNPTWAIADRSPSRTLGIVFYVSHIFRLPAFFLMAGFFARLVCQRKGRGYFIRDRLRRILVPLGAGWLVLYPLLIWIWILGAQQSADGRLPADLAGRPAWMLAVGAILTGVVFRNGISLGHLWFLYYLLMLYGILLTVQWLADAWKAPQRRTLPVIDRLLRTLFERRWAPLVLAVPVGASLYWGRGWFGVQTPDTTLVPDVSVLVAYGTFFAVGWFLHRQPELLLRWVARWKSSLGLAIVLTAPNLASVAPLVAAGSAVSSGVRVLYASSYSLAMWFWVIAVVGAFLRYCSGPSRVWRYVADSSYWLYLGHLPLVAFLQVAVADLPWHWSAKFALILAIAIPMLLASYHLLVRYTVIGAVLNGHRHAKPVRAH